MPSPLSPLPRSSLHDERAAEDSSQVACRTHVAWFRLCAPACVLRRGERHPARRETEDLHRRA